MAGKTFFFNTNVSISENYATNFFDVSAIQLISNTDFDTTDKDTCVNVLNEQIGIYDEIQTFCTNNIDEQDIYTFTSKLQEAVTNLRPTYINKMSFTVANLNDQININLIRSFVF